MHYARQRMLPDEDIGPASKYNETSSRVYLRNILRAIHSCALLGREKKYALARRRNVRRDRVRDSFAHAP